MTVLTRFDVLFYYDGPQVVEATDRIGGSYIAVLGEVQASTDRYLVAGVEPERLHDFREGKLDLRSLLVDRAEETWFIAEPENGLERPWTLIPQKSSIRECRFLPKAGFVLHAGVAHAEALKEARQRNDLVLEVSVDPPEAVRDHRIRATTLSALLDLVQAVVKHAYGSALRSIAPGLRRKIDRLDSHLLDVVVPARAGSFRVLFSPVKRPNLILESELGRAMEAVDRLFASVLDPKLTLESVQEFRGHLISAYIRLLEFLAKSKTGLRYSWAEPGFKSERSTSISEAQVRPILELLSSSAELTDELITLAGELEKADKKSGRWRLLTEEGIRPGQTDPGGPSLEGLEIGKKYIFSCIERIKVGGGGREKKTLFLTSIEKVSKSR